MSRDFDPADSVEGEAAGELARAVALELARPLRELREALALMMEGVDRHMAEAGGPVPLSWKALEVLRQELAEAYILGRRVSRLAEDLSAAVARQPRAAESVDVGKLMESALNLTRHHISSDTEVFVDMGSVPSVRVCPSDLLLLLATLLTTCAESTRGIDGSAISVKTRSDGDEVVITLSDNGRGAEDAGAHSLELAELLARRMDGQFAGTSEPGMGSAFELRLSGRKSR